MQTGTFTTLDECPIVDAFSATPLNPTKVQFDWSLNGVYEFVRIKLREDYSGATWFNAGGFGVNYPAITKNKNGLLPSQTYRAQARTWCNPNGGAYNSLRMDFICNLDSTSFYQESRRWQTQSIT